LMMNIEPKEEPMSTKKKPAKKALKSKPEKSAEVTPKPEAQEVVQGEVVVVPEEEKPASKPAEVQPESETQEVAEQATLNPAEMEPEAAKNEEAVNPATSQQEEVVSLPVVGDVLERTYKGKLIRVEVVEGGFRHEGTVYSSLSKLAKILTGYKAINGRKFFNVGQAPNRPRGTSLQTKIKKIDGLIEKLRDAVKDAEAAIEKGKLELAEAEAKRAALSEQAGTESP
jgi:hypothetical protein